MSPLDRVTVGVPVIVTASSNVQVMEIASPTPYAELVASQPDMSGVSASMTTVPGSPDADAAAPPAASLIVPPL